MIHSFLSPSSLGLARLQHLLSILLIYLQTLHYELTPQHQIKVVLLPYQGWPCALKSYCPSFETPRSPTLEPMILLSLLSAWLLIIFTAWVLKLSLTLSVLLSLKILTADRQAICNKPEFSAGAMKTVQSWEIGMWTVQSVKEPWRAGFDGWNCLSAGFLIWTLHLYFERLQLLKATPASQLLVLYNYKLWGTEFDQRGIEKVKELTFSWVRALLVAP